ncbi:hypothetical protein AHAS_Ahas14G0108100 [Arachis hypogaea]
MMTASSDQASEAKSLITVLLLLWDDAVTAKKLLLTASQRNPAHLYLFRSEKPPVSTAIEYTPMVSVELVVVEQNPLTITHTLTGRLKIRC